MAGRVAQFSAQLLDCSSALPRYGKRHREDSDDERPEGVSYVRYRAARDDWDSCRGPAPWRGPDREGDGGCGFAA